MVTEPDRQNYYNKKLQPIGWYKRGVFRKVVAKSKHLLRIMDAWGVDSYVVADLEKKKADEIRIKEIEEDVVYAISLDDFKKHAVERNFETKQMFVSRKFFNRIENNA